MAKFRAQGTTIDYTPVADVAAGQAVKVGPFVGVADVAIPANKLGALRVSGIYEFNGNLGSFVNQGTEMDIDFTLNQMAINGSGDTAVKVFAAEYIAGSTTAKGKVFLNYFGG